MIRIFMNKKIGILIILFAFFAHAQPPIVFIEGNIGAGKSTFVKILQKYLPNLIISLEPCDEWQNVQNYNLLHEFYKDPVCWGLLFQIYASMTRIRKQQKDSACAQIVHMMERSWFSDRYCFAQMLHDSGKIDHLGWAVYEQMWDWYMRNTDMPLGFIYLQVAPEICLSRLKERNRSEEAGVPLEYLQKLHECHEKLLIEKMMDDKVANFSVLVLDGSLNFKDDVAVQTDFIRQILDFLKIRGNIDLIIGNDLG